MIRKRVFAFLVALLSMALLITVSHAQSRGWSWMKRLPVAQFSAEDSAIFHASVDRALDMGKDGEMLEWHNPETGHSGSITPLSTEQLDGKSCRKTRFENQAGETKNRSEYFMCKQPDGVWAVDKNQPQ